jgi:PAS domain S-box-containing protein
VWVNNSTFFVKDWEGRPQYSVSVVIDITERKQAEEKIIRLNAELENRVLERTASLELANEELAATNDKLTASNVQLEDEINERIKIENKLRSNESQLAHAQQIAHLGSWEWDVVNDRVIWSAELCRIYGVQSESAELSYEDFLQFIHDEDRERVKKNIEIAYQTQQPFEFEHRIIRPNGEERFLQARGEIEVDASGKLLRMLGTGQDITERKHAEEVLRTSEARFRAVAETAHDAIISADNRGQIIFWNKSARDIFGYAAEEVLGQPLKLIMPERFQQAHFNA